MKTKKRNGNWNKIWYLVIALMLTVCLYAVGCYPIYTSHKGRIMQQLYHEIQEMELADLDDEDIETLNEFQKEKFDLMIVNEKLNPMYTSRSNISEDSLKKHFVNRLDRYKENPTVERRQLESRQVLTLRGLVYQNEDKYYVYLKKDVQSGLDIIQGTAYYFGVMLLMISVGMYFLIKQDEKKQKKQAQKSDYRLMESQQEFVANISHELKTPLAVISSQVEMLEIAGDKIDRPYYYASIREELDKMSKMVGELLDFSMLDNQLSTMKLSKVNMSELLEYLLLRYDALFQKNEIKVIKNIAENKYVYGNRMYLERAVNNYLMNAFQHTPQGKKIVVILKEEKKELKLEVYNDGEQIAEERLHQIWDSFYTSAKKKVPSAEDAGNIGLGLFVVRKIVENLNGSCGVENKEHGVLFWIKLSNLK